MGAASFLLYGVIMITALAAHTARALTISALYNKQFNAPGITVFRVTILPEDNTDYDGDAYVIVRKFGHVCCCCDVNDDTSVSAINPIGRP